MAIFDREERKQHALLSPVLFLMLFIPVGLAKIAIQYGLDRYFGYAMSDQAFGVLAVLIVTVMHTWLNYLSLIEIGEGLYQSGYLSGYSSGHSDGSKGE